MKHFRKQPLAATLTSVLLPLLMAQTSFAGDDSAAPKEETPKWDVTKPPGKSSEVAINVTQGTWMSLDVSPDGKTIAFDMLGDIYVMPITGGAARPIASGMAWEIQPRFSPDGNKIAFTSDRAGGDNIWFMNAKDGEDKTQITKESFRLLNNPTWSADGRFIAARKHFTTSSSLGTGEIWLYHTDGGSGVQLTKKPGESHQKEIGEPIFSPDGKYVYFSANTTSGARFQYAQDSNGQLFEIKRYELATGKTKTIVSGAGGAVRPALSPDGKTIVFVRRERAKSKLYKMNIESGKTEKIYDNLDQDMQETWAVHGAYPNMDFTPNGRHLIFWAGGKIRKLNMKTGKTKTIEFSVRDSRTVMAPPRPKVEVSPDSFDTKMMRFVQASPNGNKTVFESLGKLYVKHGTRSKSVRLTALPDDVKELYPSWSRDGSRIVFTTWTDADLGAVRSIAVTGADIKTHTKQPGHYFRPSYSPNGKTIVFEKGSGGYITSGLWSADSGIYKVSSKRGKPVLVTSQGENPHFGKANDRIFVTTSEDKARVLKSFDMSGEKPRTHATSAMAQSYLMAPDGRHIAFRENYNLYVMPTLNGAGTMAAGAKASAVPVKQASAGGATYPAWSDGGKVLNWSLGPVIYKANTAAILNGDDAPETGINLSRKITADRPSGTVALIGARIITMADGDGGVIEDGVILIKDGRITRVGSEGSFAIPASAKRVLVHGKTIMPGLIDAHAHGPQGTDELIPQQNWSAIAHLALGVTTVHDPSSRASEIFAASDLQRAGKLLAPHIFSTGEVIYGAKAPGFFASIDNAEDASAHVARLKAQGAHSVKNYNQPRREQRQQVVSAARAQNMAVVAEGGSLFHMDLSMVADGNTTIEHNLPQSELYDDVIQFYSGSNVSYTPTLIVTYGGLSGERYYYQDSNVWEHPILSKHVPPNILQPASVRRETAPESDYADAVSAATAKKLMEAGVRVSIGAHGQREGLGSHWEMWSFVRGGMSPLQALKTATVNPASALGYSDDIGSLEAGKLADLIIMSDNPLDNIRNTDHIEYVMIGGRLYESETMNEIVTGDSKRAPYFWE